MGIVFIRTWSMSLVVSFLILFSSSQVIADEDELISRTSNVHSVYSPMSDQHDGSLESPAGGPTPPDWAGHANPYSRNKKYEQQYYDPSAYHHQSQHQRPQKKEYGYYPAPPPSKKPGKGKDKDHLLEFFAHFFDKKKELEDEIWDLIFHKGVGDGGGGGDEDYKGHYGEPPSGYHHGVKKPESKEKIFLKIKLLAIASTVLLIVLGGGILLAPLAIGKGRSEFLRALNPVGGGPPTEMAQLAANVLQAIQSYQQQQQTI